MNKKRNAREFEDVIHEAVGGGALKDELGETEKEWLEAEVSSGRLTPKEAELELKRVKRRVGRAVSKRGDH